MGFQRQIQPAALDRAELATIVTPIVAEELAFACRTAVDPFGIAHDCLNPAGHEFIASCGEVVCCHCAVIAWR